MIPSIVARQVRDSILDNLRTTFSLADREFAHQVRTFARLTSNDGHTPEYTLIITGTGSGKTGCEGQEYSVMELKQTLLSEVEVAVLDVETTGLSAACGDRVVEIAVVTGGLGGDAGVGFDTLPLARRRYQFGSNSLGNILRQRKIRNRSEPLGCPDGAPYSSDSHRPHMQ